MSANSKRKGDFLRGLNRNRLYLRKRAASRKYHDLVVLRLVESLRRKGVRCYILSEYVKEKRTPDAILFDGKKLVAIEVEQDKRYKPSHEAIRERLEKLNRIPGFFDETRLVFVPERARLGDLVRRSVKRLTSKD